MQAKSDMQRGWEFASNVIGANMASESAHIYVEKVEKAIEELRTNLLKISTGYTDEQLGGFAAEAWHAGTFNVNAAAAGSKSIATAGQPGTNGALARNNYASVDVRVTKADGSTIDYSLKYDSNYKSTAKEQSRPNTNSDTLKYGDQIPVVPSNQYEDVKQYSDNRANNDKTPEPWRKGFRHTADKATKTVSDGEINSDPLSKDGSVELARERRKNDIDLEKRGVTVNNKITSAYIMKQATKAGLSAAVITMIMQTAPEIFKAIDYLIKNGEIDINQIKRVGTKAISSSAEGFLRGSVACTLQIMCEKGAFGAALKGIDPTFIGTAVALTIETIKNSILVAAGEMQPREMGAALVDSIIISGGYVVSMKIGSAIGGLIVQAIGFELPVVGYLLGSLIGTAFSVVYNIGKKKLISFCVDTGFTCFGLVEQDYQLPEEILKEMGIDTIPISRAEVSHAEIGRTQIGSSLQHVNYETIDLKLVKRGIIGVNKVGYVIG